MKSVFPPEWRTQSRWKRRFYAKSMGALERAGYVLVAAVFAAFVAAFNVQVEDLATADKVALAPFANALSAKGPTLVLNVLAKDLDTVRKGQILLETVTGDDAIRRYREWEAVQSLPNEPALAARYPKPPVQTLVAPADGAFRLDAKPGATVEDKATLARVVDYSDLRLEASLGGDTVPRASTDCPARIVNVAVEPVAGTLFRGGGVVSGKLLGEGVRTTLAKALVGREVLLRDDLPLSVREVTEVQVDAPTATEGVVSGSRVDPSAGLVVAARVVGGTPSATVQMADLPPGVARSARAAAASALRGAGVRVDPEDLRLVVKLKAGPGRSSVGALPGTVLARTFDAKLRLIDPPQRLIDAVREADATGRAVTARVELVTGTRPIALRLLKKS